MGRPLWPFYQIYIIFIKKKMFQQSSGVCWNIYSSSISAILSTLFKRNISIRTSSGSGFLSGLDSVARERMLSESSKTRKMAETNDELADSLNDLFTSVVSMVKSELQVIDSIPIHEEANRTQSWNFPFRRFSFSVSRGRTTIWSCWRRWTIASRRSTEATATWLWGLGFSSSNWSPKAVASTTTSSKSTRSSNKSRSSKLSFRCSIDTSQCWSPKFNLRIAFLLLHLILRPLPKTSINLLSFLQIKSLKEYCTYILVLHWIFYDGLYQRKSNYCHLIKLKITVRNSFCYVRYNCGSWYYRV